MGAAAGAVNAIRLVWSIHSPSRVGFDLGANLGGSVAGGIDALAKTVARSSANLGEGAIDSAQAMLGSLSGDLISGIDSTPTIRPVIDMTDVQRGVSEINGLFNANRSLNAGVFSGAAFNRNAANMNFDGARIMGADNNKEVVDAIHGLTDRFNHLSDAVTSMKLVLDTGTLVGEMGTKMDKQLGVLAGRHIPGCLWKTP